MGSLHERSISTFKMSGTTDGRDSRSRQRHSSVIVAFTTNKWELQKTTATPNQNDSRASVCYVPGGKVLPPVCGSNGSTGLAKRLPGEGYPFCLMVYTLLWAVAERCDVAKLTNSSAMRKGHFEPLILETERVGGQFDAVERFDVRIPPPPAGMLTGGLEMWGKWTQNEAHSNSN
ncbi:hypothetical protein CDAR_85071 [Caerostris darwini]|uniref:Uncharacterized protein n=1 Tax=Caerostris darwini TaxID=1538125 RepID=A0AAV4N1E3_9ARAC|nr:hypothetical protein CDAR_85071 [Caerostris darwini]